MGAAARDQSGRFARLRRGRLLPVGCVLDGGSEAGKLSSSSSRAASLPCPRLVLRRLRGPSASPPRFGCALSMSFSWLMPGKRRVRPKFPTGQPPAVQIRHRLERQRRLVPTAARSPRRAPPRPAPAGHLHHELDRGLGIETVHVVAEIDRAVRARPAGEINPRDRNAARELHGGALARRDLGVDVLAAPARLILQDPGREDRAHRAPACSPRTGSDSPPRRPSRWLVSCM